MWRVVCIELNNIGAWVLSDHASLQCQRDRSIPCAYDVIPLDTVKGARRDGHRRSEWSYGLRTLPGDRPSGNIVAAGPVQRVMRRRTGHQGDGRNAFDHDIRLNPIAGSFRK